MKKFRIEGELIVDDKMTHEELLRNFYNLIQSEGIFFIGQTKEIKCN